MNISISVPFHGNTLYLVEHNGEAYTPMRPIVEGMGLDWKTQYRKLMQRFNSCVVEMTTQLPGDTQGRSVTCLLLRKLTGWLYSISPNKVRPDLRDKIVAYQNECDDVLWRYWTLGRVENPRLVPAAAGMVIDAANLEQFRQELRTLREVAMSVAGTLRPLMGRDGGEVTELFTRAQELPLHWSRLDVGLMSLPVTERSAVLPVAQALPAPAGTALSDMDAMRRKLEAWSAGQPAGAKFTVPQIMLLALGLGENVATKGDMIRLGKGMRGLGWRKVHAPPGAGRYWALQKARY